MQENVKHTIGFLAVLLVLVAGYVWADTKFGSAVYLSETGTVRKMATTSRITEEPLNEEVTPVWPLSLDIEEYDQRLLNLVGYTPPAPIVTLSTTTNEMGEVVTETNTAEAPSPLRYSSTTNVTVEGERWPPAAPYPNGGAILPFERIIAYYGNFYSTRMGILGEFPEEEVLSHLASTTALWEAADPDTPVRPAIHYIAMVAQGTAGADGMWRNVMPDAEIEKGYQMAKKIDGILFIDLQVGLSTIERELPKFRSFLERPEVHLGIDPEFSMKSGNAPGTVIGTFDAEDINYTINYLSEIVKENQLPPKVLVIHRFTQNMVTNYQNIKPTPEVQVVMHMDGWGSKQLKRNTYSHVVIPEPVQFAGLKIFYKNDLKPPSTGIFTPTEALELNPKPVYIQYQ